MKYRLLNEALIEWNESFNKDSDNIILQSEDIKRSFIPVNIKDYRAECNNALEYWWGNLYQSYRNVDVFMKSMQDKLNRVFGTKENFENFVEVCIKHNWEDVCDTNYCYLDSRGWNIFILQSIEEEVHILKNKLPQDILKEMYDVPYGWRDFFKFIFGKWGMVWYMIEDNTLDIDLPDHPEACLYESINDKKFLNEVLIEWNETAKEDSDNITLQSEDIKKSLNTPRSSKDVKRIILRSKLLEISKNPDTGADEYVYTPKAIKNILDHFNILYNSSENYRGSKVDISDGVITFTLPNSYMAHTYKKLGAGDYSNLTWAIGVPFQYGNGDASKKPLSIISIWMFTDSYTGEKPPTNDTKGCRLELATCDYGHKYNLSRRRKNEDTFYIMNSEDLDKFSELVYNAYKIFKEWGSNEE